MKKCSKQKTKLSAKLKKAKVKIVGWKTEPEILLCDNIPKPMHGVAPRVILGSKWWNQTRQEAYKSTGYHCLACGIHKNRAKYRQWMEGHELYKVNYKKGTMKFLRVVPLCHLCHNYIHDGRLLALLKKGKITHGKFKAIIQHGDNVLAKSGLKRKTREEREDTISEMLLNNEIAEWSKWRLVIRCKKYPPKFKSEYQLRKAFE